MTNYCFYFLWRIQTGALGKRPRLGPNSFHAVFGKNFAKQECIPVGCIPPASVAISWGRGCLTRGVCQKGVCLERVCLGGSARWGGCLPRGVSAWGCLPHTPYGQTDACENITLPQTSFAGGNNRLAQSPLGLASPAGISWIRFGSNTIHLYCKQSCPQLISNPFYNLFLERKCTHSFCVFFHRLVSLQSASICLEANGVCVCRSTRRWFIHSRKSVFQVLIHFRTCVFPLVTFVMR